MIQDYRNKCNLSIVFAFILTAVPTNGFIQDGNSVIYQIGGAMLPQIAIPNAPQYSIQAATQFNPPATPQFAVAQIVREEPLTSATSINTVPFNNRSTLYQSTPALMLIPQNQLIPQMMTDSTLSRPVVARVPRACVKCPSEIRSVAHQGMDGVLVEPPAPVSCATNLPFSSDLYSIETLFGSRFMFVLPHGKHTLFAKIRNMRNGLIEATCPLRYDVVVRRCPRYRQRNLSVRMMCSAGSIWGSSCTFACRNVRAQLSHQEPVICNENSEWIGQEPTCLRMIGQRAVENVVDTRVGSIEPKPDYCRVPDHPPYGRYSCEMNSEGEDHPILISGSICRINCNPSYSIPTNSRRLAVIQCIDGAWNTTTVEVCQRQRPPTRRPDKPSKLTKNRPKLTVRYKSPFVPKRVKVTTYS